MRKFLLLMAVLLIVIFVYKNKKSESNVQGEISRIEQQYSYKPIAPKDPKRGSGIKMVNKSSVDIILSLKSSLYPKTKISAYDIIYSNQLGDTQALLKKFFVSEYDAGIRYQVLQNIARYKGKSTLDILTHVVQFDGSQQNRLFALNKIIEYKHPDILPILVEVKERNSNKDVKVDAAKAYETLNYDIEEKRIKKEQQIQVLLNK